MCSTHKQGDMECELLSPQSTIKMEQLNENNGVLKKFADHLSTDVKSEYPSKILIPHKNFYITYSDSVYKRLCDQNILLRHQN